MLLARQTLLKGIAEGKPASALRERLASATTRPLSSIVRKVFSRDKPDVDKLTTDLPRLSSRHHGPPHTSASPSYKDAYRHFARKAYQIKPNSYGRRRAEYKKYASAKIPVYLDFSPTYALAAAVDIYFHGGSWTETRKQRLQAVASSPSLRLPVLTTQLIMRDEAALHAEFFSMPLPTQDEVEARLGYLAPKGIKEELIAHWIWILSAPTGDSKVRRFLSTDAHKPLFLFFLLLETKNSFRIREKETLTGLLEYLSKQYVRPRLAQLDHRTRRPKHRSLDHPLSMTGTHFARLLFRLTQQALNLWPALLVTIAHIVASFIQTIPARAVSSSGFAKDGHAARCLILNRALAAFERPARQFPFRNSTYNWEAQRVLLALANRLEPRLILNLAGYRAVRRVLLRLRKSNSERRVAERYARTWPPYRQNWDGIDEQRTPEDDLSRSAKAGVLTIEAGYSETAYDRALTALGGGQVHGPPTIQTRSLSPVLWTNRLSARNVYSAWASEVRATRNAQEAWAKFNTPPSSNLKPDAQVYAAMFEKLLAREASSSPLVLPGDTTREAFLPYNANLSAFEKARLQPPTTIELYRRMRLDGVRPVGSCLAQLIKNAESLSIASEYLQDSSVWTAGAGLLLRPATHASVENIRQLPLTIFNAWISLLCRLEEGEPIECEGHRGHQDGYDYHVLHAFNLCSLVLRDRPYRPPWYSVLRALAGHKFSLLRYSNRLTTFLQALYQAKSSLGTEPALLEQLAIFLQKYLQFVTGMQLKVDAEVCKDVKQLNAAHENLTALFDQVIRPVPPVAHLEMPPLYHEIFPIHLYRYMRALVSFGDADGLVRAMRWILQAWERDGVLEEAKTPHHPDYRVMEVIFSYFDHVGSQLVPRDVMDAVREEARRLVDDAGCIWVWLGHELVDGENSLDLTVAERWTVLRKEALRASGVRDGKVRTGIPFRPYT